MGEVIRSLDKIIKDDKEAKEKEYKEKGVHQTFNAEVGNVINNESGGTVNIDQSTKPNN